MLVRFLGGPSFRHIHGIQPRYMEWQHKRKHIHVFGFSTQRLVKRWYVLVSLHAIHIKFGLVPSLFRRCGVANNIDSEMTLLSFKQWCLYHEDVITWKLFPYHWPSFWWYEWLILHTKGPLCIAFEETIELPVILDAMLPMWRHCDALKSFRVLWTAMCDCYLT